MYEQEVQAKIQKLMDSGFTYEQAIGIVNYVAQEKAAESEIAQQSATDKKRFILRVLESVIKAAEQIRKSARQNWEDFIDNLMDQFSWSQPRYEASSIYDDDDDLSDDDLNDDDDDYGDDLSDDDYDVDDEDDEDLNDDDDYMDDDSSLA